MRTHRTLPTLALLAAAMVGLGACAQIDSIVTDRDLTCADVQDDLCRRIADLVVGAFPPVANSRDRVTVEVERSDCSVLEPDVRAARCWHVSGTYTIGVERDEIGVWVYARPDGGLSLYPPPGR